jgi:uncharacterized repeat protein (TIGR03803 family)
MKRIVSQLGNLTWVKRAGAVFMLCAMMAIALPAQTFTTLYSFDVTETYGPAPGELLIQAANGYLYGTALGGGAYNEGTVFNITPSGTLTTVYSFSSCIPGSCPNGAAPGAGLVQATNGYLYGTASSNNGGTVFKITPSGTLTTLYTFCSLDAIPNCPDGDGPHALVQAANGDLYGATSLGGNIRPNFSYGAGTIFKITPSGTLTTLYKFCSQTGCPDGAQPSGLFQATNGDLYGATGMGGVTLSGGTVFKITPSGTLTTLYSFANGDGPPGALVQANGDIYGTAGNGGANNGGTVFKIAPGGTLTMLYSFCSQTGCTDGEGPAGLILATDGNLYGTTAGGGDASGVAACSFYPISGCGTVFRITPTGTLTTLYTFCTQSGCPDGGRPNGLVQATNGTLYGITNGGGAYGSGTVFSLSLGLGPFVKTLPAAGVVGEGVRILGYDLTGATSVSFNGIPAVFTVVSSTEINARVPTGATTGWVQVVTPSGTLSSNVYFLVAP